MLAAAYPAGTFVGALPGGWMAARVGVRPTVLLGLGLLVASSVAFAFADSIVVLDVARFVQGIGGAASWAGALGWLIGAAPRERRGQYIGTALAAAVAGALFGPVLGAAAGALGQEPVFGAVAVVGAAMMVWALRMAAAQPEGDSRLQDADRLARRPPGGSGNVADDAPRRAVRHRRRARAAAARRARRRLGRDRRRVPGRRRASRPRSRR